jgi:hypothetical protein
MDYVVSGVNPGRMVTSFGRPGVKRGSQPLRGEVIEVVREGGSKDDRTSDHGGHQTLFGYANGGRAFANQAWITLKVRTDQDLSDLVGKRVVVTLSQ